MGNSIMLINIVHIHISKHTHDVQELKLDLISGSFDDIQNVFTYINIA